MAYTHSLSHMVPPPILLRPQGWNLLETCRSCDLDLFPCWPMAWQDGTWIQGRLCMDIWYIMVPCMYHVKGPLTSSIPFWTSLDFLRNRMQDCIQLNDQSDILLLGGNHGTWVLALGSILPAWQSRLFEARHMFIQCFPLEKNYIIMMHNAYTVHNLHDCFTTWSCNMFHPRRHSCSLSLRAEMEPVLLHSVRRSQNAGDMRWHEVTQVLQQPLEKRLIPWWLQHFLPSILGQLQYPKHPWILPQNWAPANWCGYQRSENLHAHSLLFC